MITSQQSSQSNNGLLTHSLQPYGRIGAALRQADLRLYQTARSSYHWAKHERKARTGLPFQTKLSMWRRGFFAESATIYDFPRNNPAEYLSDFQHFVRCGRINAWEGIYTRKLGLRAILLAMGFRQPEPWPISMSVATSPTPSPTLATTSRCTSSSSAWQQAMPATGTSSNRKMGG